MFVLNTQKRESGFTIVELLIAVIVIAILATIAIMSFQGITIRASDAAQLTEVRQLSKQIEALNIQNGSYPSAVQDQNLLNLHDTSSTTHNMWYVVNKPSMTDIERQKLANFESSNGMKVPLNAMVYSGQEPGNSTKTMVYIMARFKNLENIPTENRSNRLVPGSNNDAFPQLVLNASQCIQGKVTPDIPQSTTGGGSHYAVLRENSVRLGNATVYRGLAGCGVSQTTWFLRDDITAQGTGHTGLFVIKQP